METLILWGETGVKSLFQARPNGNRQLLIDPVYCLCNGTKLLSPKPQTANESVVWDIDSYY